MRLFNSQHIFHMNKIFSKVPLNISFKANKQKTQSCSKREIALTFPQNVCVDRRPDESHPAERILKHPLIHLQSYSQALII